MLESKIQTEKSIFIEMILNKTVGQLLMIFSFAISLVSGGIIFSGLECHTVDPSFCTIINCIVKPLGRGLKEINARVRLLKVPVDNVTVSVGRRPSLYFLVYVKYQIFIGSRKGFTSRRQ